MDFSSMTTDDLLAVIPADEDDKWEKKSAAILTNKGELKKELGKQVSAFANSGGGYLAFGVDDKTGDAEPCEQKVGRQSMKDYLSAMTEQSVEQPIRDFRVYRVPFKSDQQTSVFVVQIGDSPAAPHQAKELRQYFYRIDGHSMPAPHFHIDLLRNRITRAVLEIQHIDYTVQRPDRDSSDSWTLNILLHVEVQNVSLQCASKWGILLRTTHHSGVWYYPKKRRQLVSGVIVRGEEPDLLPSESTIVPIHLTGIADGRRSRCMARLWSQFDLSLRPVTQDHVGAEILYGKSSDEIWSVNEENKMSRELQRLIGPD